MALLIENGSGVFGANSYIAPAFVTAYLLERGRAGEGGWTSPEGAEESAACIAGTDFIEVRFRSLFLGSKFWRNISVARATWTPTAQPSPTETITIGSTAYTFGASVGGANSVLIGATLADTIENLVAAIAANPDKVGTSFGAGTAANPDATACDFIDDTLLAFAKATGTKGNSVAVSTTVTGATWNGSALFGGSDIVRPQPLSFPRAALRDRDGVIVEGIPLRLQWATAEYAVRARAASLIPDPTHDALGGTVTSLREKVGPIETATSYLAGSATGTKLRAYPAADRLLSEYLSHPGVIRG